MTCHLPQSLGRQREIGERGEAAKALAQQAPALHAEFGTDALEVAHDGVGAEVRQVFGLLGRRGAGQHGPDGRGAPGAALVQQQHAEIRQRARQPARGRAGWPRGLQARAALQEDEVGLVAALGRGDLAGEDAEAAALRVAVHQRASMLALGQHGAGDAVGGAHRDAGCSRVSRHCGPLAQCPCTLAGTRRQGGLSRASAVHQVCSGRPSARGLPRGARHRQSARQGAVAIGAATRCGTGRSRALPTAGPAPTPLSQALSTLRWKRRHQEPADRGPAASQEHR